MVADVIFFLSRFYVKSKKDKGALKFILLINLVTLFYEFYDYISW